MSDTVATMGDAGKAMPVPRGQYSDTETYEYLDFVYCGDASYIAKKLTTGNPPAEDNEYWQLFARGGTLTENSDVSNTTVTFEQAENRANIFSKESLKTMAGKVSKMYSDLKSIAFSGKYTDLEGRVTITNNDLATIPGTAWDAVRGAQIRKDLDKLNSDLPKFKNFGIFLKDVEFTRSAGGMYYTNVDVDLPSGSTVLSCAFLDWSHIRETDRFQLYIPSTEGAVGIMSNTNDLSSNTHLIIRVVYI